MTKLYEALVPVAQKELVCDGVIELVTVIVEAVPDPDRPNDQSAMTIAAELYHDFRGGIPAIDAGLAALRGTCIAAAEDISPAVQDRLVAALARDRGQKDEFRQEKINGLPFASHLSPGGAELLRPENFDLDPKVLVWCHAWTAGMCDDGMMCVDRDEPVLGDAIDEESRRRIRGRVRAVDKGIAAIIDPLMREG